MKNLIPKSRNYYATNNRSHLKSAYQTQMFVVDPIEEHDAIVRQHLELIKQNNERKFALSQVNAVYCFPKKATELDSENEDEPMQPMERASIYANPSVQFKPLEKNRNVLKRGHSRALSRNLKRTFDTSNNDTKCKNLNTSNGKCKEENAKNSQLPSLMNKRRIAFHRRMLTKALPC